MVLDCLLQRIWYTAGQLVRLSFSLIQVQPPQIGEVAQLARDSARQLVALKVQRRQPGEFAQLTRNSARQLVGAEVQSCQIGEGAQFRRDTARQSFVG